MKFRVSKGWVFAVFALASFYVQAQVDDSPERLAAPQATEPGPMARVRSHHGGKPSRTDIYKPDAFETASALAQHVQDIRAQRRPSSRAFVTGMLEHGSRKGAELRVRLEAAPLSERGEIIRQGISSRLNQGATPNDITAVRHRMDKSMREIGLSDVFLRGRQALDNSAAFFANLPTKGKVVSKEEFDQFSPRLLEQLRQAQSTNPNAIKALMLANADNFGSWRQKMFPASGGYDFSAVESSVRNGMPVWLGAKPKSGSEDPVRVAMLSRRRVSQVSDQQFAQALATAASTVGKIDPSAVAFKQSLHSAYSGDSGSLSEAQRAALSQVWNGSADHVQNPRHVEMPDGYSPTNVTGGTQSSRTTAAASRAPQPATTASPAPIAVQPSPTDGKQSAPEDTTKPSLY